MYYGYDDVFENIEQSIQYILLSTTYIHTKAEDEATLAGAYRLPQHANGFFNLEIGQKSQILIFNLKMLKFTFDGLAANK